MDISPETLSETSAEIPLDTSPEILSETSLDIPLGFFLLRMSIPLVELSNGWRDRSYGEGSVPGYAPPSGSTGTVRRARRDKNVTRKIMSILQKVLILIHFTLVL